MARIRVDQPTALSDQALEIVLEGFAADATVEVVASRRDFMNNGWRAWARFRADADGRVDLSTAQPLVGTYSDPSAMGLFWSMQLTEPRAEGDPERDITGAIEVHLAARGGGEAEATVRRIFCAPGVTDRWLDDGGNVGLLFLPPSAGPHPAVIVLSGSSGGINLPTAALLASRGFAALALGYFNMPGLPPTLDAIPLEYFAAAIAALHRQPEAGAGPLAAMGISRGGELALLLGATYPEIGAVVATVPSGVVHGGLTRPRGPAWTLRGEPVDWLQRDNACTDLSLVENQERRVATTPLFESSLRDAEAVARSMIPVECIQGPVLLISGRDDRMWPSTAMAELSLRRLREHGHPHAVEHLAYDGAGHLIHPPFAPTTRRYQKHGVLGTEFDYGGGPAANAHACADSWPKVLDFLGTALRTT